MIFYLGEKVNGLIPDKERETKNRLHFWDYGYNRDLDVVIISKDGTLGEIYDIQGLKIGLPQQPDKKDIINHDKNIFKQKWERHELPAALTDKSIDSATAGMKDEETQDYVNSLFVEHDEYITREYTRRDQGVWIYINGHPIYMPGTYYYGVQWIKETTEYPNFRVIQNELMIFWEACKADERCYGMQYVKNRRMGASLLAIMELLESGTITEDKILGMISKKGDDAKKIFRRLIKGFKRLPLFFKPITDGTNTPKKELIFEEPTKRRKKGEKMGSGEGLSTSISWHNTDMNAMDGEAIFRSLLDECYAPGTKILMGDLSFKNIEDIKVGEIVTVENGKKVKVAKTTNGETEMFKVIQKYEKDYVVSKNHRLYLEQRCKVKGIHDDGIKIMTPEDYLSLGKYKKRTTFGVKSKGLEFPSQELPIDPYIFGVWLGDGESSASRIIVNMDKDPEIADAIEQFSKNNNFSTHISKTGNSEQCSRIAIRRPENEQHLNGKWNSNKFMDSLKDLMVLGGKNIPLIYLDNSFKNRLELLAGIIDTDGYLANKNGCYQYELVSSKESLANQYNFLCRSLGFKTTIKKRTSNLNTEYWAIYITGDVKKIPCRVARKITPKEYDRSYASHINKIDIEPIGLGKYYGIQVEADNDDDRRLILEDFTISMNSGKYPTEVKFSEYWSIVKTSHRKGVKITGKSMVVSTVNSLKKGGGEYKKVWDASNLLDRNSNGQTKSGLYRIFIAAKYCLEGMFDEFGFSIVADPPKPLKTDEGTITSIGSETWLRNEEEALKGDPEKYNEQRRQFPETIQDAFRDASDDCEFNLPKILEQLEHNEWELNDKWTSARDFIGNDDLERGNFTWENGIQDTVVVWRPDPENGRFFIKKGCHPPSEYKNKWEDKFMNGVMAKSPLAGHIGAFGVDPYNRSKNADGRGSKGCIIGTTTEHTCDELPRNAMIVEYIDRPRKVKLFFEDVIMVSVYFSMPFLAEQSNDQFLAYVKDRGYRHYSLNNPFKLYKDLTPQEKEFGGAPQQDTKIGDQQFYASETYIEDYVGVARDHRKRPSGDMGDMPFTRTLQQLKDVDTSNRTKFDAYIGFSLSLLGNQKRVRKTEDKPKPQLIPFQRYDNSGTISKTA